MGQETKEENIWVNSIKKHISLEEFKKFCYKEGHVYKINKGNIQKCIGFTDEGYPIVDSIFIITDNNKSYFQFIKTNNDFYTADAIPSLDFVNHILDGTYKEIDANIWDEITNKFLNIGNEINMIISKL